MVNMKKRFTKRQLEIMKILWDSEEPMIASDIVKKGDNLNINTVQACLRLLIAHNAIKIADIVYSGTVLTRSYTAIISKEDYLNEECSELLSGQQTKSFIASLINAETNLEELEELEKLIERKKEELKKGR